VIAARFPRVLLLAGVILIGVCVHARADGRPSCWQLQHWAAMLGEDAVKRIARQHGATEAEISRAEMNCRRQLARRDSK
jgi:hypothetical protein